MKQPGQICVLASVMFLTFVLILALSPPTNATDESSHISFSEDDAAATEDFSPLELELLSKINDERTERDMPVLSLCEKLSEVAQNHAEEMIEEDFFSHLSPNTGTPGARVRRAGLQYKSIAENLAGNTDVSDAHNMLMESTAHKANLLSSSHDVAGIAVVSGGRYGKMIVQLFARLPADEDNHKE